MLRRSVGFGGAALLVVGLPMSSLALSATVLHETTSSAEEKLRSIRNSLGYEAVVADIYVGRGFLRAVFILE